MGEPTPVYTSRLQGIECGRVSRENERGWTARLTIDDEKSCTALSDRREFRTVVLSFRHLRHSSQISDTLPTSFCWESVLA